MPATLTAPMARGHLISHPAIRDLPTPHRVPVAPSLSKLVAPSRPHQTFIAAVRRSETDGVSTLIALHDTGATSTVVLTLRDEYGNEVPDGSARVTLPANGHLATRLETLFPGGVPEDFRGTLTGTVQAGTAQESTVVVAVIRLDSNSGTVISMPVKEVY